MSESPSTLGRPLQKKTGQPETHGHPFQRHGHLLQRHPKSTSASKPHGNLQKVNKNSQMKFHHISKRFMISLMI